MKIRSRVAGLASVQGQQARENSAICVLPIDFNENGNARTLFRFIIKVKKLLTRFSLEPPRPLRQRRKLNPVRGFAPFPFPPQQLKRKMRAL